MPHLRRGEVKGVGRGRFGPTSYRAGVNQKAIGGGLCETELGDCFEHGFHSQPLDLLGLSSFGKCLVQATELKEGWGVSFSLQIYLSLLGYSHKHKVPEMTK